MDEQRETAALPVSVGAAPDGRVPAVYEAIARISAELATAGIGKGHKNKTQDFMYRGIDDVYQVLCTLLPKHGLVIIPRVVYRGQTERASKSGGALFSVVCEIEFDLISTEDGSSHTARIVGEAMDSADKGTNKAMAIAYKYMAFMLFCIPLEGVMLDPDADAHEVAATKPDAKQPADATPTRQARRQATPAAPPKEPPPVASASVKEDAPPINVPPPDPDPMKGVDLPRDMEAALDQHRDILSIAPNEAALRKAFAAAYTWASEITDAKQRTYVLLQITDEKDTRKAVLAAEAEAKQ